MYLKKLFQPVSFEIFIYSGVIIKKLKFIKVIFLTYFDTKKYRVVEKNDSLQ